MVSGFWQSQFYKHKEIPILPKTSEFGKGPQASVEIVAQPAFERRTQINYARLLSHQCYEIINMCCVKLLNGDYFSEIVNEYLSHFKLKNALEKMKSCEFQKK